jgi:hypothetical protein
VDQQRADYYIEKVRYNKNHSRIMWISVRENSGAKLSGPFNMVRKQIISLCQQGKSFMTIYRGPEGKYRKGKKISLVQVNGIDYIRADENAAQNDKLEDELPEY